MYSDAGEKTCLGYPGEQCKTLRTLDITVLFLCLIRGEILDLAYILLTVSVSLTMPVGPSDSNEVQ